MSTNNVIAPNIGDFTAWVVGMPGPDIDYALCIDRKGDKALLRFQVWQNGGDWHEEWVTVTGASMYGCWATDRIGCIKHGLREERARLFPKM